ncbi:Retrovirus-related Pol polyprotein from transposon RE1 [Linum grandiflorum]
MKQKSETRDLLMAFHKMVHTQYNSTIKIIRTDQGKEFHMTDFYSKHGIIHQMSCVQTPAQNARVERKHQHILNVARALQFQSGLPLCYWSDFVLHSVYLINRMPTPLLQNRTPFERIYHTAPDLKTLRVFGCLTYASTLAHNRTKFQPRARQSVLLGLPPNIKGYKLLDINTKQIFISRDVVFYENIFPFKHTYTSNNTIPVESQLIFPPVIPSPSSAPTAESPTPPAPTTLPFPSSSPFSSSSLPSSSSSDSTFSDAPNSNSHLSSHSFPLQEELSDDEEELDPQLHSAGEGLQSTLNEDNLRRSTRQRNLPIHLKDYHLDKGITKHSIAAVVNYANLSATYIAFALNVLTQQDPNSYEEASKYPHWNTAVIDELGALEENQTWDIVPKPNGARLLGSKWVFRTKFKPDGAIERHKARLVAQGCSQVHGVDFVDTFSPVAKINTVKTLLAVAAAKNWFLQQMDVSNAFLHGDLMEEVYMKIPPGLNAPPNTCCKLKKSLYGLKQASRQWFAKLTGSLLSYGFKQTHSDYSLFIKGSGDTQVTLLVYVDDLILAGGDLIEIEKIKKHLCSAFKMKDLGDLRYFLGLEIARSREGIVVNQRKYCIELLNDTGFLESKGNKSPMDVNLKLNANQGETLQDPSIYRNLVGRLHYLTITRPDIAFAVQQLSQFQANPCSEHLEAAHRILRYLKSAPGQGLIYRANNQCTLSGFCDSDWASCPDTRRSVTGYCTYFGNCLLTWKSKKQSTVSRSSSEAEYRALAHLVCEVQWLAGLLNELGVHIPMPMTVYCDNKSAIHIAENPVFHERTKHIEIDCHVTRDRIKTGMIKLQHVNTEMQLADLFTKAMHRRRLQMLLDKLGVFNLYAPTCGRVSKHNRGAATADEQMQNK